MVLFGVLPHQALPPPSRADVPKHTRVRKNIEGSNVFSPTPHTLHCKKIVFRLQIQEVKI